MGWEDGRGQWIPKKTDGHDCAFSTNPFQGTCRRHGPRLVGPEQPSPPSHLLLLFSGEPRSAPIPVACGAHPSTAPTETPVLLCMDLSSHPGRLWCFGGTGGPMKAHSSATSHRELLRRDKERSHKHRGRRSKTSSHTGSCPAPLSCFGLGWGRALTFLSFCKNAISGKE